MTKVIAVSELVANIRCLRNGKTFLTKFVNQCEVSDSVIIQQNATNGDVIKAIFPKCEQKEHINNNGYFEMYFDNDLKNADYMRVSKEWWNAPYKSKSED